jgi:hypothetical protein
LPLDAATVQALSEQHPGWGAAEELLALACELLDLGNRQYAKVHAEKGAPTPKPLRIPRPDRPTAKEKRKATAEEMRAFFGAGARFTGPSVDPSGGDASPVDGRRTTGAD